MINFLENLFREEAPLVDLNSVSDGICSNNGKNYIDFDKFKEKLYGENDFFNGDYFSSTDSIILNREKEQIIFIEFKSMKDFEIQEEMKNWFKSKKSSVYLKMSDSILGLSTYFNQKHNKSYDDFMDIPKIFIYVYDTNNNPRVNIRNHLKGKFVKYNFLYEEILTLESDKFKEFLNRYNL